MEALKLMRHFEEFLGGETSLSSVFNDKSRLYEAADIIRNLQLIAQELPASNEASAAGDLKNGRGGVRAKVFFYLYLYLIRVCALLVWIKQQYIHKFSYVVIVLLQAGIENSVHTASFDDAKQRIDSKYAEIEQHLLEEFVKSERSNDCQRMKDLALILSQFKVLLKDILIYSVSRKL